MTADVKHSSPNVDAAEIAKFNDIASRWWDPAGEFKPLHLLNPVRLSYISDELQGLFAKQVIDIGCGGGILAESMSNLGADTLGIDLSDKALKVAEYLVAKERAALPAAPAKK